jgi:hypothetical protein
MDKQKREQIGNSLILLISVLFIFIIADWLWRARLFPVEWADLYRPVFYFVSERFTLLRGSYIVIVCLLAYSNSRVRGRVYNKPVLTAIAVLSGTLFVVGYLPNPYYNTIVYPLIFFTATFSVHEMIQATAASKFGENVDALDRVSTSDKNTPFAISTDKGVLKIPAPTLGIYQEGAAGSGKSVTAKQLLYQAATNGYAGVFYDFEGNPLEHEGADISRVIYTALKKSNSNVKFAFLNFNDLTKTVRVNPVSPKYLRTELDVINVGHTLMKNLEKEWVEKTDFWASNAINVVVGALLMLRKSTPQYCTIPHLISFILSDFRAVLNYLATDKELEPYIMPVMSAYKQNANQQTAGVISSSQLPLTKLYVPEIYWVFNPPGEEEFNLDITNKTSPAWLCIGNNPKQKQALSPVIALTLSICMEQMNQFDRVKAFFAVDELPTIYIPNLDILPATARKKGVVTYLLVQTFKQLEGMYGKNSAEIIRDNLSTQLIGKTNSYDTADRISKMFGEYKKAESSFTLSDSGESQTQSLKNEKFLQPKDITQQPTGHWTGFIANASPPFFHAQFDEFKIKTHSIPQFSKRFDTGDAENDRHLMEKLVRDNFIKVKSEIDELLSPYRPVDIDE